MVDRAQPDRAYIESLLTRQLASWKSSQEASNPQTLELELTPLRGQFSLEARYTDDHPDVIKMKADIAGVTSKLAKVNTAAAKARDTREHPSWSEPAEIRRLRLRIRLATLVMGLSLARWLQMRDKLIRTEADVEASLQAPILVSLAKVTDWENTGSCKFWSRQKKGAEPAREKAAV
jgi:hypothetical protein